jgi:hypothetical protein
MRLLLKPRTERQTKQALCGLFVSPGNACIQDKDVGSATISLHNGMYTVGTNVIVTYRNRCSWAAYLYDTAMSTLTH